MAASDRPVDRIRRTVEGLSPARRLTVAVGTYPLWTAAIWVLEGRRLTLRRPEATVDRLAYTGVANVLVETLLAVRVAGAFVSAGVASRADPEFRGGRRAALANVVAVLVFVAAERQWLRATGP